MNHKLFITTTIPYVNAEPHIGHALEFVQADVVARMHRARRENTYFLSGTDENAIKNVQAAEKAGVSSAEWVDKNSALFRRLLEKLNISTDQFIRTTEERHRLGAQALWRATDPDDIYKKKYGGLYCVGCEQFYKSEELDENGECFEHPGRKPESVEEENYFFRLSKYGPWLKQILENGELKIVPDFRKNELLALIDRGLEDFSISRPVARSKNWGVAVPGDPSQTIYVWYDALANYITALGYPDKNAELYKNFWAGDAERLHVLGKGVSRFHGIYWPAMLKSAGLPIPTEEFIHGYITVDGRKISKTLGNVVDPFAAIEKYGADAVRYFLLSEISAYGDGDWSEEKFKQRYNADLANGLGNFAARVLTLAEKFSIQPEEFGGYGDPAFTLRVDAQKEFVDNEVNKFKFNDALAGIWELIALGDEYINSEQPWKQNEEIAKKTIVNLLVILDALADLLEPFLPQTAAKIEACLWEDDALLKNFRIKKGEVLFPRLK